MSCQHVYLALTICVLAIPYTLVESLGKDTGSEQNIKETEERLLARLIAAERQKWDSSDSIDGETMDIKNIPENSHLKQLIVKLPSAKMSCQHVYLALTICVLAIPYTLVESLGKDTGSEQNIKETEERLLARLIAAERQKWDSSDSIDGETMDIKNIPENSDTTEEELETFQRVDSDRMKIDITLGNKLIEQRLLDCKREYELIIVNDDGTKQRKEVCYIHKMEKKLSDSACKENREKLQRNYKVGQEVKDKDFLSQDGPDSVCKTRPMYQISPADNVDQDDVPTRVLNKRGRCSPYCCQYGWWWSSNVCEKQCVVC